MFKSVKTSFLAAILVGSALIANAQKKISQGTITYSIEYGPELAAMVSQLPKEQKLKFNGNIISTDAQYGPAKTVSFRDFIDKKAVTLIDIPIMQKQYAVKMTKEEIEQMEGMSPKLTDFKPTGEKQKIANYNAEKYTYKDDKGTVYELWATTEVELPDGFSGSQFKDVKGTLVKYTTFENGAKITLTAKNISDEKVGPFSLEIPSSYELKTMQEIMAMMQGGGQ
ncbi:MAG: hypothetical protein EOO47_20180 [Flavobacterium sp.]|nr:MAG: hypothetical protein EOO47_20180 [Flavobacterium sp.]